MAMTTEVVEAAATGATGASRKATIPIGLILKATATSSP